MDAESMDGQLMTTVLVVTKNWKWAAMTCAALWFVAACGSCRTPPWPRPQLMTAEADIEAEGASDVLNDGAAAEEVEPEVEPGEAEETTKHNFIVLCEEYVETIMNVTCEDENGEHRQPLKEWPFAPGGRADGSDWTHMKEVAREKLWQWASYRRTIDME